MSTPFCLLLPRRLCEEMLAQAQGEFPKECCGLLAGKVLAPACPGQPFRGQVVRRYPLVNELASALEYLSEPRSMLAAVRDIDRLGLDILGVYHSHPTSDSVPSRKDLERSYSSEVVNLIISLKEGNPAMRAWWLSAESYQEAEWEIIDPAQRRASGP